MTNKQLLGIEERMEVSFLKVHHTHVVVEILVEEEEVDTEERVTEEVDNCMV